MTMDRRRFVTLATGAFLPWPAAAARMRRIGILDGVAPDHEAFMVNRFVTAMTKRSARFTSKGQCFGVMLNDNPRFSRQRWSSTSR